MLVAMKKVDPKLLDELRVYFDQLDVCNSGELCKDHLIEIARRKMSSPRRKLELHAYKQHLLKISRRASHQENKAEKLGEWVELGLEYLGISSRHQPTTQDVKPPSIWGQ
jgi:hypothetical protein